jgi:hypothetical protein
VWRAVESGSAFQTFVIGMKEGFRWAGMWGMWGGGGPVELWYWDRLFEAVGLKGRDDSKYDAEDGSSVQRCMQNFPLTPTSGSAIEQPIFTRGAEVWIYLPPESLYVPCVAPKELFFRVKIVRFFFSYC